MKKFAKILVATLTVATFFATSASAAIGDIKIKTGSVTEAPVQDGKITAAEYGNCDTLVFDGSGKNTEGTFSGKWGTEKFTVYSAWDAENLYLGITVEGDTTNNQVTKESLKDSCPFGKTDSFQLGFNPGSIIKGVAPVFFCFGLNEGECYVHAEGYRSEKDGEQTITNYTKLMTYCTKYSESGLNYSFEVAIPWDEICVKGACKDNGAKVFDMTGELKKINAGYELPFYFSYADKDAAGKGIYIRSDANQDNSVKWKAENMGSIAFVLQSAQNGSSTGTTQNTYVSTPSSPQTSDASALVMLALAASAAGFVALKKRK